MTLQIGAQLKGLLHPPKPSAPILESPSPFFCSPPVITPSCDASHRFRYTRRRNLWGGRCCFSDIATRQSTLPSPLYTIAFHSLLVSNVKRGLPTQSVADCLSDFRSSGSHCASASLESRSCRGDELTFCRISSPGGSNASPRYR